MNPDNPSTNEPGSDGNQASPSPSPNPQPTDPGTSSKSNRKNVLFYGCLFLLLVLAIVLIVVGISKNSNKSSKSNQSSNKPVTTSQTQVSKVQATATGFNPASISIKAGTKLTWLVTGTQAYKIASNPYPEDNSLSSLKSEYMSNSQSYTYVFSKPGTYYYHNDLKPAENGQVIVK